MKKFFAILAIVLVICTISSAFVQAMDEETYIRCRNKCKHLLLPHIDYQIYLNCFNNCVNGIEP